MRYLFLFLISLNLFATEKLVTVTAVSTSMQTFVTTQGAVDGISVGKKALFSTDQVSLKATATTVARDHTIWQVDSESISVPFMKGEYIVYNSAPDQIWYSISKSESFYREERKRSDLNSYLVMRGSLSRSFSESVSYTQPESTYVRGGYSGELLYQRELNKIFSLAAGGRLDSEQSTDGVLAVPSSKYYLIGELIYNFSDFGKSFISNYYLSLGGGFGQSMSNVNGETISGTSMVLPYVRLGFVTETSKNNAFFFETMIEAVSTKESFATGEVQTTNTTNGKLSIGWRKTL